MVTLTSVRPEAYLSGAWVSLAADLATSDAHEFTFRRGMGGSGPTDRVATIGMCSFGLRNHSGNSGSTQGWYSPNHASVRTSWTTGIPIRVRATYAAVDYTLWTGKLRSATPSAGLYRGRIVSCLAHDCMSDLSENDASGITPQVSQTENAIIAAILAALPAAARPTASSYGASLDTYDYALDNAATGTKAMSLITDVVQSAQAYAYPRADGTIHVENRQARTTASSSFTFTDATLDDVEVPSDLSNVYNHVRATIHPRTLDTVATTVLYGVSGNIAVEPGQSVTVWGNYTDPSNTLKLIGATNQVTPIVAVTDYSGNSASGGGGTDLTASLSVVTTAFAGTVKFVVTNASSSTAYLVTAGGVPLLQIRGSGIRDNAPTSYESQTTQPYGDRLLDLDLKYQGNAATTQALVAFLEAQYNSLGDQVQAVAFNPQRSATLMGYALTLDIGAVGMVTETMTGLAAATVAIQAIEMSVTKGPILSVRWVVAPRGPSAVFLLDDAVYGVLDSADALLAYA